jgi:type IV pilus assembly protein PilW
MKARLKGFGLVEILLALVLGLVMSLALMQVFVSAKSTYLSQTSSAAMQEDARFILSKIVREISLAGMFGCLSNVTDASNGGSFSEAFDEPVRWDANRRSLTLATAAVEGGGAWHTWVVHTDCVSAATAYSSGRAPGVAAGELALPIRRQVYQFNKARGELALNGQPLISHVRGFSVLFGVAHSRDQQSVARYVADADSALIRSVRLTLTLFDPDARMPEQTFSVVAAVRNRLG